MKGKKKVIEEMINEDNNSNAEDGAAEIPEEVSTRKGKKVTVKKIKLPHKKKRVPAKIIEESDSIEESYEENLKFEKKD